MILHWRDSSLSGWLPLIPTSAPCTAQPKGSLGMNKGVLSNKWGEIQLIAAARKGLGDEGGDGS